MPLPRGLSLYLTGNLDKYIIYLFISQLLKKLEDKMDSRRTQLRSPILFDWLFRPNPGLAFVSMPALPCWHAGSSLLAMTYCYLIRKTWKWPIWSRAASPSETPTSQRPCDMSYLRSVRRHFSSATAKCHQMTVMHFQLDLKRKRRSPWILFQCA